MPNIEMCNVDAALIAPPQLATEFKSVPACSVPSPAPPYFSGMMIPIHPAAANAL
jgi:hypothetical protein